MKNIKKLKMLKRWQFFNLYTKAYLKKHHLEYYKQNKDSFDRANDVKSVKKMKEWLVSNLGIDVEKLNVSCGIMRSWYKNSFRIKPFKVDFLLEMDKSNEYFSNKAKSAKKQRRKMAEKREMKKNNIIKHKHTITAAV